MLWVKTMVAFTTNKINETNLVRYPYAYMNNDRHESWRFE